MKTTTYTCDKCGSEIKDVVYELCCWAEDIGGEGGDEAHKQNTTQNILRQKYTRHLCKECKDTLTDGVFIV